MSKIPTLFLFVGLPSCGKSMLTKKISNALQIPRISTDETWKQISPDSDWSKTERIKMYSAVLIRIKDHLTLGSDVIADGVYSDKAYFKNMQESLSNIPYKIKIFKIECSLDTMLARFIDRKRHEAIDLTIESIKKLKQTVNYNWLKDTIIINTDEPFELYFEKVKSDILNARSKKIELSKRKLLLKKIIHTAGSRLNKTFRTDIKIKEKDKDVFVTQADLEIDNFLKKEILQHFPEDSIHSEESEEPKNKAEFTWYIDPIDGTHMYMRGIPTWCVSVGVTQFIDGNEESVLGMVYDPIHDDLYEAERGQGAALNGERVHISEAGQLSDAFLLAHPGFRKKYKEFFKAFEKSALSCRRTRSYGVTALELCFIAAGFADIYISSAPTSHDLTAALLILEESGGTALNWDGKIFSFKDENIIAGNKKLVKLLAKRIRAV